jgi:hypothetical protein
MSICPLFMALITLELPTDQAQDAIAAETVRIIKTFKETGEVPT